LAWPFKRIIACCLITTNRTYLTIAIHSLLTRCRGDLRILKLLDEIPVRTPKYAGFTAIRLAGTGGLSVPLR
jgi:hypothetical protein